MIKMEHCEILALWLQKKCLSKSASKKEKDDPALLLWLLIRKCLQSCNHEWYRWYVESIYLSLASAVTDKEWLSWGDVLLLKIRHTTVWKIIQRSAVQQRVFSLHFCCRAKFRNDLQSIRLLSAACKMSLRLIHLMILNRCFPTLSTVYNLKFWPPKSVGPETHWNKTSSTLTVSVTLCELLLFLLSQIMQNL